MLTHVAVIAFQRWNISPFSIVIERDNGIGSVSGAMLWDWNRKDGFPASFRYFSFITKFLIGCCSLPL